jgi:conjugative transfer region lipoprotein (TIGR03751 family)
MKIQHLLLFVIASISITACSSMSGNVVPKSGPDMERVYDSMGHNAKGATQKAMPNALSMPAASTAKDSTTQASDDTDLKTVRGQVVTSYNAGVVNTVSQQFYKLPNPEVHLYVFPHFAGSDEIPVPGYYTVFNAYERDHYALAQERG